MYVHVFIYINNFSFAIECNTIFSLAMLDLIQFIYFLSSCQMHSSIRCSSISSAFSRRSLSTEFFHIFPLIVGSIHDFSGFQNLDFSVGNSFSFQQNVKWNLNWSWQISDWIFEQSVSLISHLNMQSYVILYHKTIFQYE